MEGMEPILFYKSALVGKKKVLGNHEKQTIVGLFIRRPSLAGINIHLLFNPFLTLEITSSKLSYVFIVTVVFYVTSPDHQWAMNGTFITSNFFHKMKAAEALATIPHKIY